MTPFLRRDLSLLRPLPANPLARLALRCRLAWNRLTERLHAELPTDGLSVRLNQSQETPVPIQLKTGM